MALDQNEPLLEKERVVTEDFEAVSKQEREKRHRFNDVKHKSSSYFLSASGNHTVQQTKGFENKLNII